MPNITTGLTKVSTVMDRAIYRRLARGNTVMNMIANTMTEKDFNLNKLTMLQPISYHLDTGYKDLAFPKPVDFEEIINDRKEWNGAYTTLERDGSRVGGTAMAMSDNAQGEQIGNIYMESGSYYTYDKILSKIGVANTGIESDTAISVPAFDHSNTDAFNTAIEKMFIDTPHTLRGLVGEPNATINALVPYHLETRITRYLLQRDTELGDSAVRGARYSKLFNLNIATAPAVPYQFTLAFSGAVADGDTFNIFDGSNFVSVIAKTTLSADPQNEFKAGTAAVALTNLIKLLTNQTEPKGDGTNYGYLTQYDVAVDSGTGKDKYNLQRRQMYVTAGDANNNSSTVLTVFGSLFPPKTATSGKSGSTVTLTPSNTKAKVLFVAPNHKATFIVRDEFRYGSWHDNDNMMVRRHQFAGTMGADCLIGGTVGMRSVDLTIA